MHRDLKPANVFLARNKHGRVVPKLLDFGIARVRGPARAVVATGPIPTPTTQAGMILGTPAYMSPEQARGEPVTKASDLFSFGAMLFECLTGEVPFDGINPNVVMARIVLERAQRVADVAPSVPAGIARAIDLALSPDPRDRPPSAAALAALLRAGAEAARLAVPAVGTSDCAEEDPELATTLVHTPRRLEPVAAPVAPAAKPRAASAATPLAHASTGRWAVALFGLFVLTASIAFAWTRHQASATSAQAASPAPPPTEASRATAVQEPARPGPAPAPTPPPEVVEDHGARELAPGAPTPSRPPREAVEGSPRPSRTTSTAPIATPPAAVDPLPPAPPAPREGAAQDEALPQLHEW